ncbi:MAG: hypothetical protein H7066_00825 [Cytophagaceae bacterium]|nr:hypothetical protein [Gemmatimonadaceae bacterium]
MVAPAKAGAPRRWLLVLAALGGLMFSREARAQREPLATDSVGIDVRVLGDSVLVNARFWFPRPVRALDLTYLTNTCVSVSAIAATRNGVPVAFSMDTTRPWVTLHDTTDAANEGDAPLRYDIAYRVHTGHATRVAIPVIQPARALDARSAAVTPKVRLQVTSTSASIGVPEFPRFQQVGASRWSASTIAVPATIVVRGEVRPEVTPCDDAIRIEGENDGFTWRFAAFVGTLVLWIPLYFAWATRRRRGDDDAEETA